MNVRIYEAAKDYATLEGWWRVRGLPPVPSVLLPELGVFVEAGIPIAAGFCYFDSRNQVGMVDWISTNPKMAIGPTTLEAVAHIFRFFEKVATERGCHNLFSFVAQDTGLHRFMVKSGWQDPHSAPHVMLFKSWP